MQACSSTYHFAKFVCSSREYGSLNPAKGSGIEAGECQRSTCHYASRTSCASKSPLVGLVPVVVSSRYVGLHCFLCTRQGSRLCNSRYGRAYRALGTPNCTSSARLHRSSRTVDLRPRDLPRLGHQRTIVRLTWNHGEFRVLAENGLFEQTIQSLRSRLRPSKSYPREVCSNIGNSYICSYVSWEDTPWSQLTLLDNNGRRPGPSCDHASLRVVAGLEGRA